jgi:hypothetical protein
MSVQWAWWFENTIKRSTLRVQESPQFQRIALVIEIAAARVKENNL